MPPASVPLALLLCIAGGCPQSTETPDSSETGNASSGSGTMTSSSSSSSSSGGATVDESGSSGGEPPGPDLWACGLAEDCPQLYYHIEPAEAGASLECAARIIASAMPGHITALHNDGSTIDDEQWLLLEPDGTAIVQRRERRCALDATECTLASQPWSYFGVLRCTLGATEGLVEACAADAPECSWHPWYGNLESCTALEAPTCEELEATLASGG